MRCKGLRVVCVVGVEGVMRSCCEKTMGVLRQNKESLITIIEVLNVKNPFWYSVPAWRMLDSTQKFCCSPALLSIPACQGCWPVTLNNSDGDKHKIFFSGAAAMPDLVSAHPEGVHS